MNRRTRTLLPTTANLLKPKVIDERDRMKQRVRKQADYYNNSAKTLTPLDEGDTVRMQPLIQGQKGWEKATVMRRLDERSYIVETPTGRYRRNRMHLRKTVENPPISPDTNKNNSCKASRGDISSPAECTQEPMNPMEKPGPLQTNKQLNMDKSTPKPKPDTNTDLGASIKTRSGRVVTKPKHLKDYFP